jgi:hypothetical protein
MRFGWITGTCFLGWVRVYSSVSLLSTLDHLCRKLSYKLTGQTDRRPLSTSPGSAFYHPIFGDGFYCSSGGRPPTAMQARSNTLPERRSGMRVELWSLFTFHICNTESLYADRLMVADHPKATRKNHQKTLRGWKKILQYKCFSDPPVCPEQAAPERDRSRDWRADPRGHFRASVCICCACEHLLVHDRLRVSP